jgi:outer membrane protein, adhesin transport system
VLKSFNSWIGLAVTFAISALPFNSAASSMSDSIMQAIEHNPEVKAKWYEFISASEDVKAAKAGYKPQINSAAGYQYQRQNYGPVREYDGAFARLTLTQMLYDGGKTSAEADQFSNFQLVAFFNLLDTAEQIALEAFRAHQDVVKHRKLVDLAKQNLDKHFLVYRQIESSAKAGVAKLADLEQISGRVSLAQTNLVTETSNLHDVSARYLRITGKMPAAALEDVAFKFTLPETVVQSLESAYANSPAYHAALRNITAYEFASDATKAAFRPNVNLVGSYGYQNYSDLGLSTDQNESRAGIEISYNFYNGGRDSALRRQSLAQVNIAKELRDKACYDIRQNVQISYNDSSKIASQLPLLNQHRLASDKVRTAYKQQFDIGQRSLLDVLDSENEHFQASRAYFDAVYTLNVAKARNLAGSGVLMQTLSLVNRNWPSLTELGAEPIMVDPKSACPLLDIAETANLSMDSDGDGVTDIADFCPNTPVTDKVDIKGCSIMQEEKVSFRLDLKFDHNSATLSAQDMTQIADLVTFLNNHPSSVVEIQGHTSMPGKDWYNVRLSQQRADSVKQVLLNQYNVPAARVNAKGYGSTMLLSADDTETAHALNRRIEAVVSARQETAVSR